MPRDFHIKNATAYYKGQWQKINLTIKNGKIENISSDNSLTKYPKDNIPTYNAEGLHLFPGFIDIHVHFREPGQEEKETIATGTRAAARGGYTTVCTMPNLDPVPDSLPHLAIQQEKIKKDARVHVFPYASITIGQKGEKISDLQALAPEVFAFSDDGFGVQNEKLMKEAMLKAKSLGKCIVAHAEEKNLVKNGVIHDGKYAHTHGHNGNPSISEWKQVERDLKLAEQTGVTYHVCHVSTKESIELIRDAKRRGVNVTCETAPHYLVLNDELLQEEGRFRMNPPIRSKKDQLALLQAVKDGTILCIATDHAPHTAEEKSRGLDHSLNGIVGLETAFPILYTKLVETHQLSLEALIDLFSTRPKRRFSFANITQSRNGLPVSNGIEIGEVADLTLFDLSEEYCINPDEFLSKGKASPFSGEIVRGRCKLTIVGADVAYYENTITRWSNPEYDTLFSKDSK